MEFKKILRPFLPRNVYNERVMERENTRNESIEYDEIIEILDGLDDDTAISTVTRLYSSTQKQTITPDEAIDYLEPYTPEEPIGFQDYSDLTARVETYEDKGLKKTYLDIRHAVRSFGGDGRAFRDAAGELITFEVWPSTRISMEFDEDVSRYLED